MLPLFPVVLLLSVGCNRGTKAPADEAPAHFEERDGLLLVPERSPLREHLVVEEIHSKPVRHELTLPASIEADPTKIAKISLPFAGRIAKLHVRLGDRIEQGAPLFMFDSSEWVAAQSEYIKARSAERQAERNFQRQKDLHAHGIVAAKELEQAETEREIVRNDLSGAAARLRLLGIGPSDVGKPLVIRSPIAGRIVELTTAPGQYQNDASTPVMTVADLSAVWVAASVPEKDIRYVRLGEEALVALNAYPGEQFEGHVEHIGEVLTAETRAVKVRIALDNTAGRFKPGMFARATLRGGEVHELLAPTSALVLRGERTFLYVEKAPWQFERRLADIGERIGDRTCILAGLSEGERIITSGTVLLP
ncbi:MAG: efflux RND transporter periplasmic adaptor subunit [Cystobacterineae bacterium]|nr:efflux RND transporter periplasmic adaptor subunit [Cystobacterineae bacterium]